MMFKFKSYMIFYLVVFLFSCLLLQATLITGSLTTVSEDGNGTKLARIGVILDQTSRPGKEAKVAIELAIQDFKVRTKQDSVLYLQNSRSKPFHAAVAAKELIAQHKVKVILGGNTWEEASAIAEVISEADHDIDIPIFLSLAGTTPLQTTDQWPFFVQAVPTQSTQMNAVAAVLHSMGIRKVTLIYETASSSASIISYLSQAFLQTGSELTHILPLSSISSSLHEELEGLKRQQRKVFVIHTSLELAVRLFKTAKEMEMTGDGYLWIATNAITDLFHSINSTMISSLKGMVGVKSYFPEDKPEVQQFRKRFRRKFTFDYPEEEQDEPGIFAMQGYNAVKLLENLQKPSSEIIGEIVNVIGKGYHSVYWTEGSGFSETIEDETNGLATNFTNFMDNVGQVLWPVQPWYTSRRRRNLAESSENVMRVGVPAASLFKQFVELVEETDEKGEAVFDGFVVKVFEEMMSKLNTPYKLLPFHGSYEELIQTIPLEQFDAIAGDVTIVSTRHEFADFTQPFTESGLEMIVPVRSRLSNQAWLFLKPFSPAMWWLITAITIYNGFIIWLIERSYNEDLRGSIINQIGVVFWLAFTTLFTLRGDKLHSNLSRMAVVVWLFVALIITQSYTASLASMLTAQRLEPAITSVEMLRNMNATVGYCNGSFINDYLMGVLHFPDTRVNHYNSTHRYAEALNSGEIAAIFLEVPSAKVFLAQYCKSFIRTGETFKVGGFGFAFPKGFTRLSDANKALMNVSESGKLKELEEKYLIAEKCIDEDSSPNEDDSLSPRSFWVLFLLTGGTSTISLAIYIIIKISKLKKSDEEHTSFLILISAFIKDWQRRMRRSSSIVVNVESARHTRNVDQLAQDDSD